jgi:integrase
MTKRRGAGEGSCFRRADGRWVARFELGQDGTGRRQRVARVARTKAAALMALEDARRIVERGDDPRGATLTVAAAVADYCEHGLPTKRTKATLYELRYFAEAFGAGCGRHRLRTLTVRQVETWLESRAADWSPRTLRLARAGAGHVLDHAARLGWLPPERNVARLARLPESTVTRRPPERIDAVQVRRLLEVAGEDWWAPLLTFTAATGCRVGEAAGLAWSDVDCERMVVHIRQAVRVVPGGAVTLVPPKARSARLLAVPQPLLDVLKAHRRRVVERALGSGVPAPDLAFPTLSLTPAEPHNLRRWLRGLGTRAQVPISGFHALRHAAASGMADAGIAPIHAAAQLGHSDSNVTLAVYTHPVRPVADAALGWGAALLAGHEPASQAVGRAP